jgi:hypothetical protein
MKVWVYTTACNYLIVKRTPYYYRYDEIDISTGTQLCKIISGNQIELPKWDWVRQDEHGTWAGFSNLIYEISDLA